MQNSATGDTVEIAAEERVHFGETTLIALWLKQISPIIGVIRHQGGKYGRNSDRHPKWLKN